jgi:hypothetical protein
MSAPTMTVQQIEVQIADARRCLAAFQQRSRELALPTVGGDPDAIASLAETNSASDQVLADLVVLEHARAAAVEQQAANDAAAHAEYCAGRMAIARDRAGAIVKLAARIDGLISEFETVFTEMSATENEIRKALREAGAPPNDVIIGQRGLGVFAIASLTALTSGTSRFNKPRAVADVATMAWADLLEG